jgi:uncharacterized membrane protein
VDLEETDAVADEAPGVTAADHSVEVTTCFEVASLVDVSVCVEATFERPFWSCSTNHRVTATRSFKS